ncbi:Oxysterol-binding protein [Dictyocaulus viviparus]|uniref:Oxysterol-binding protein n=1 Tax=Dictyocaulus viviparus TaxID=29172 RepID=A0A0D8Y164_DICVI|nr:Oxysterol-binding protein [Dictyocaulus viviparus]
MVYVAAFAVSPYTNSTGRYRKFFNPLLGETYEYEQEDFKYHGEQVSHHPSVSAGHAIGNGWTWFQTFSAEVTWNAWAQTCEFVPDKPIRLQLTGEEYMWNKITTHIESLLCVPEERKLYHEGTISVKCSNGVKATINVARNKEISGEIVNAEGKVFCTLSGKWDERLCRYCQTSRENKNRNNINLYFLIREMDSGEKEQLIATSEWPIYRQYFGFTDFTMRLNELRDEDRAFLPPTDSRFRPDVRCLEYGNLDDALAYKKSMEQAQRDRAINEETYKPLWFVQKEDSFTNKTTYASTGKYWEAKETKFEKQKNDNSFIPIFTVSITK